MKRILSILMCAALLACLAGVSAAETDLSAYSISSGVVQAAVFEDLTAPCSGTLRSFDLSAGDPVAAGETLMELLTATVTAPEDGTVRWIFAEAGDSADAAVATYGAVLAVEPARRQRIACTYLNAADYEECKQVHLGQTLYFHHNGEKLSGIVVAASADAYEVEILEGSVKTGRSLEIFYRDDFHYRTKVGTGRVYNRPDVLVPAAGRIIAMNVAVGDSVKKGDALFTLLAQDADAGASPQIVSPCDGVLGVVPVQPGQQVWKGALLARVCRTDALEIVAEVDEMDLNGLKAGDEVPVTLDTNEGEILTGTVTEISGLGVTRLNAAYYTVHLTVDKDDLMLGQSASVYLPMK